MNKSTRGTISIKANIPEKEFMEGILNMKSSGYDVKLSFFFYALAHSWHINKVNYYLKEVLCNTLKDERRNGSI